ncbi:hypothetical protein JX265_008021 [Neoarthrinium moseri]|uniref:Uncharacterized protein n=1 Tax=Neoarthrinium moseri TaxID=1658444 RepID=A0A9P9WJ08_9PEZI|nr:uncharacterized protein JN550_004532 [Neoarthrinium moseri]KAI1849684.1 hypothetical protein JX266_004633 [Neoarthrinium moseri]KAI1865698.1 hypothetical protein JX265_008021 [Neoarthrinium moseri]KAI1871538.1 hypothetical protein JN550_004532 [Neoarthrinium moseri]
MPRHSTSRGFWVPDMTQLTGMSPSAAPAANGNGTYVQPQPQHDYEHSVDLNEITRRQLNEDIGAYRYDLDYSTGQLQAPDLTAQESRTFQLRILDLGHQIRHCQHRIELIDAQTRQPASSGANGRPMFYYDGAPKRRSTGTGTPGPAPAKRPRLSNFKTDDAEGDTIEVDTQDGSSVQRLGFWMCHLCTASKYLSAGPNRVPSAPCKWPLKDVSKMLNHFLDMHTEHDPEERCIELGNALSANRGPFEYWLTRTKAQNLREGDFMGECIQTLQSGAVPETLKKLNRAAAAFPNTASGVRRNDIVVAD